MRRRPADRRALMTVLFTDIVTSTEVAARLGDSRWREVLGSHHAAVRRALRAHGGQEMDTAGDGFFAVFRHPGEAIECAIAAREAVAALGLQIRAGIHSGEVEVTGEKVSGLAVVIAARVLASCEPGQIRVTSTVRDLVTGSGVEFIDEGSQHLKGVPGQWQLSAVAVEAPVPGEIADVAPRPAQTGRSLPRVWVALGGAILIAAIAAVAVLLRPQPATTVVAAADNVVRVDPGKPDFAEAIEVESGPSLLATNGSDLWIASEVRRTLTHFDTTSAETTTAGLDGAPTGLAVAGGTVYVSEAFENAIERFSADTNSAETPIEGLALRRLVFDGEDAWGIDSVNGAAVRLAPGREPEAFALPAGSLPSDISVGLSSVWIANTLAHSVTRIDPSSGTMTQIRLVDSPTSIAPSEGVVWVASETDDSLARIDPATNRPAASLNVCDAPVDLATLQSEVWVACAGSRELVRVGADGIVSERRELPATPSAVVVIGDSVWVALRGD